MNRIRFRAALCGVLAGLLLPTLVHGDEWDELHAAIRRSAEPLATRSDPQASATLQLIAELEGAAAQGETGRANAAALRLAQQPDVSAELKQQAERLSRELPRLIAARAGAFIDVVEKIVERTRRESLAAKTEADLLPLLRELGAVQVRQPPGKESPAVVRALRKLEAAIKFTQSWMDYLLATEQGATKRADEVLNRLANDQQYYPILPAQEYVARRAPVTAGAKQSPFPDAAAMLARITTLQEVETVGQEFDATVRPVVMGDVRMDAACRWLDGYRAAVAAYLSGDVGDAWRRANVAFSEEATPWYRQILRLRTLLLNELVPKVLKLPAGSERHPDETFADFFNRTVADAAAQGRWEDVVQIATKRPFASWDTRIKDPLFELGAAAYTFVEAQRLEKAGDYAGAIVAYELVLRSTAELAPVREATERLKALRQSQPGAFAEAHPRMEADRVAQYIDQLLGTVRTFASRLMTLERQMVESRRSITVPGRAGPASNEQALATRMAALEANLAGKEPINARLDRLEMLLGPGAEALARRAPEQEKFKIWLGSDYTVYRSALPQSLEADLAWLIQYEGQTVLRRRASKEFFYRYYDLKAGTYRVSLITGNYDTRLSNVLEFTVSEEAAAKLPKVIDRDLDRDGVLKKVESGAK